MSSVYFGNPMGLWALLALPVLVLIHCLQQRARRVRVSTLFLLDHVSPRSAEGARLEKLRQSVPFWMQILASLLVAWMLAEPRWVSTRSEQVVAVVLDDSASMSAFKAGTRPRLEEELRRWSRHASITRFHLLLSDASKPVLYSGGDLNALLRSYDAWTPMKAGHDPADALMTARGLIEQGRGAVLWVSDHATPAFPEVAQLSVAEPIENVGFTGVTVELTDEKEPARRRMKWRALVRNTGAEEQTRQWWLERKDAEGKTVSSQKSSISLKAGVSLVIEGELAPDVEQAALLMDADRFSLDDRMDIQKPQPRMLRVAVRLGGDAGEILKRMIAAVPGVEMAGDKADVIVVETGVNAATDAIFVEPAAPVDDKLDAAPIAAEHHELVRDLNWSALMTPRPATLPMVESDVPLLWRGDRPLVLLRTTRNEGGTPVMQLFLNWDIVRSNAHRVPAMLVMLHRWLDECRSKLPGIRVENFEMGQRLFLPANEGLMLRMNGKTDQWTGRVPEFPGVFEVTAGEKVMVRGTAQFADAREGDFRQCSGVDTTGAFLAAAAESTSEADPLTPVWILGALGCLVTAWAWGKAQSASGDRQRGRSASKSKN